MQCDICTRSPSPKLPFICANCARRALYNPHKAISTIQVHKESLEAEIVKTLNIGHDKVSIEQLHKDGKNIPQTRFNLESLNNLEAQSNENVDEMNANIDALRTEVKIKREQVKKCREVLAQQREDLNSAVQADLTAPARGLESVQKSVERKRPRWDMMHDATVDARSFLCREAASLYRLQQRRRRKRDGSVREEFRLGGIPIVDLRELNNIHPARITASLTGISYLVVLVSHYLSLRLPAEVTLPHREYPLPTIFSPSSSYSSKRVPFPGHTPAHSSFIGTSAPRGDMRHLSRPRPLFLDKSLPNLAKEDPSTYALFIEGVTYLAWDIAWLCQTQGLEIGERDWEDVCSLGKNLWLLLVAKPPHTAKQASPGANVGVKPSKDLDQGDKNMNSPTLGHYSHGSAHSFLGSAEGTQFMRDWRLRSPMKLIDQVKSFLLSDMTGAEWEVLEEKEWEVEVVGEGEGDAPEEAVVVDAAPQQSFDQGRAGETRFWTVGARNARTHADGDGIEAEGTGTEGENRPATRTKGWTKLKSRT